MVGEAIDLFGDPQPGSGARFDLILAINVAHISPVEATKGLFAGASRLLNPGLGRLVIYGRHHGIYHAALRTVACNFMKQKLIQDSISRARLCPAICACTQGRSRNAV